MECQVVLTAPEAVIDLATNEGCATGQVRIEIYAKTLAVVPGKEREPIAVLCTERLLWRTWNEPQTGSTELALYTSSARAGGEDPLVTTTYVMPQNDGTVATMTMEGRGLVYEFGSYDRPTPQEDEDGRTVGLNQTAHNRAIFHRDIKLVTTAAAMAALMPFQGPDGPPPPNAQALGNAKAPVPQTPSQTVLLCSGPAVLNMAAVPRAEATKIRPRGKSAPAQGGVATAAATQGEAGAKQGEASVGDSLEPILLARRFEFYNKVHVIKTPLTAQGTVAPLQAGRTEMSCENLCMQYAAGAVPGPATFPEYAEALGAVSMQGVSAPAPGPGRPATGSGAVQHILSARLLRRLERQHLPRGFGGRARAGEGREGRSVRTAVLLPASHADAHHAGGRPQAHGDPGGGAGTPRGGRSGQGEGAPAAQRQAGESLQPGRRPDDYHLAWTVEP
jgi:hypothetical protein